MDVSIIIVSYNVKDLLKNCIESVLKFTSGLKYEIIIVDNASSDDSPSYLSSLSDVSNLKVILSKENGGFAKGNNLGIKQATGKYILLLNPDTLFLENTLKVMFSWMESHTDVAVSSCQLVDLEQKISPTGGYFPNLFNVAVWTFFIDDLPIISKFVKSYHPDMGPFHKNKIIYQKEFFPDWVTGAFYMIRREAIEKTELFDENIFMYGEELEWCMRFKQAGWKVGYTPITKIIHLERKSSGGLPRNAVLGEFKGLKYIYGKHFPGWKQMVLGTLLDIAAFLRIIFWLIRLKPQMAKIYAEALMI